MQKKILYLDDDQSSLEQIESIVNETEDMALETANSIEEALEILDETDFRFLVTECDFDSGNVEEVLKKVSRQDEKPVPILFTGKDFDQISTEKMIKFSAYVSKNTESPYEDLIDELESLTEDRSDLDYPVPENEEERLKFIEKYDLKSMMINDDFDRLAEIGTEIFDTNWCFVGIITEDTEIFLSFQRSETKELDRECSICTFAINDDDVTVVEDREKDPRFKYVDELEDLGIKWYAGAPIINEEGYRIGAFCVADTETRDFSEKDRRLLKLLADEAMEKLELKHQASETIIDKLRGLL